MIKKIKDKLIGIWRWIKRKIKKILIALGIISISIAAVETAVPELSPSIIAEGQVIEFTYTDESWFDNEDFVIRTDKEIYHPLWPWNGFDIYVMVENKSGDNQITFFQPFFSKNISVEKVSILNPLATTTILESTLSDICEELATGTFCYKKYIAEEKTVMGTWNPISIESFSEDDYEKFICDFRVPIKDKMGKRAKQRFPGYSLQNQVSYYKLKLKTHEYFSITEFDLEIIGDRSGYGLLDPTLITEDFNSYGDGAINGTSTWVGDTGYKVQGTTVKEGAKALGMESQPAGWATIQASGTAPVASGTQGVYFYRNATTANADQINLREEANNVSFYITFSTAGSVDFTSGGGGGNLGTYNSGEWNWIWFEWHSVPSHEGRARLENATPTSWQPVIVAGDWVDGLLFFDQQHKGADYTYIDYVAEHVYTPPVAVEELEMNIYIIE